jgi:UDP-glucuronate decarboxylase
VADRIEAFLLRRATGDDVTGPINLGNPAEYTIYDLATMIVDLTNSKSRIVRCPLPEDDPRQRRPDIGQAAALGWQPRTPLQEGLRRTIAYFEDLLRQPAGV